MAKGETGPYEDVSMIAALQSGRAKSSVVKDAQYVCESCGHVRPRPRTPAEPTPLK